MEDDVLGKETPRTKASRNTASRNTASWPLLLIASIIIGAVAIAFRLPSTGESFWVDELHSAWAVSGDFGQVARRATVGNQTTGYFHLLWIWNALVGDGETGMRFSSVLINSITAGLLVIAVGRQTGHVAAGMVSGAMMAVDPNGVFFGCELRPYALVMLCSFLATWAAMVWIDPQVNHQSSYGGARWRLGMLFWICAGALIHPTSLGVVWPLVPLSLFIAWRMKRLRPWRADVFALVVVVSTVGALASSSLPNSWERRGQWKAFGVATDWWQLWGAWYWLPILIVPTCIAVIAWGISSTTGRWNRTNDGVFRNDGAVSWWIPGMVALLGTFTFFVASYADIVPLWHRRYFIAALPLLCWSAGAATAVPVGGVRWERLSVAIRCLGVIAFLLWSQGTWKTLAQGRLPVQGRGEAWREIVSHVNEKRMPSDAVWLDTGLIEDQFLRMPVEQAGGMEVHDWEYLSFPVQGPYSLREVTVVSAFEHESWLRMHLLGLRADSSRIWLISRSYPASAETFANQVGQVLRKTRFGSLALIEIRVRTDEGSLLARGREGGQQN